MTTDYSSLIMSWRVNGSICVRCSEPYDPLEAGTSQGGRTCQTCMKQGEDR